MKCFKYIIISFIFLMSGIILKINLTPDENKGKLIVEFIETGNSDSIFIKMPDGRTALIDGGYEKSFGKIQDTLHKYNVKIIDYMINSHQHDDHLGSFPQILKVYNVKNFYMPKSDIKNEFYDEILKILKEKSIPINIIKRGDIICEKDVKIEVLTPYDDFEWKNDNNYSAVILLTYGKKSFIFMGDAEREVITTLAYDYGLSECDVYKASHHGSKDGNSRYLLETLTPEYAVITSEDYDDDSKDYIKNILFQIKSKTYFTGESGNITMISDGKNIEVKTER